MKFMKNKGIAIRTILLLLIGVLVAGLLIYYVYRSFSGSAMSREECRSRAVSWCTSCWNAMNAQGGNCPGSWAPGDCPNSGPTSSNELQTCSATYYSPGATPDCRGMRNWCKNFIPIG